MVKPPVDLTISPTIRSCLAHYTNLIDVCAIQSSAVDRVNVSLIAQNFDQGSNIHPVLQGMKPGLRHQRMWLWSHVALETGMRDMNDLRAAVRTGSR